MAVRVRSRWHCASRRRTVEEQASVVAALGWRLAQQGIRRMREAGFDIEPGSRYFDVVCEFLAFVLHAADRIAALRLEARRSAEFTHALECVLARIVDDNGAALAGAVPEASGAHFVRVAALRAPDYSALGRDESGASYAFRCYFGNQVRSHMAAADRPWTVDQVAEIEAPEVLDALQRALRGLLADGSMTVFDPLSSARP